MASCPEIPVVVVEVACASILAVYVLACIRDTRTLADAGALVVAAWLGEESCIRAYGFYGYASGWHLWLDRVPAMIVLIWPAIVLSAQRIAVALLRENARAPWRLALATGAIVLFDAALIEPIAVHARLWTWTAPGLFGVPPIGVLGWGFFATAATWAQTDERARRAMVLIAPVATHVLLLATWWGALRWVGNVTLSPLAGIVSMAIASLGATGIVVRMRGRLAASEIFPRAVATGFFAVLLAHDWETALAVYAAVFTLPHGVLCARTMAAKNLAHATS